MSDRKRSLAAILFVVGVMSAMLSAALPSVAAPGYSNPPTVGVGNQTPCSGCTESVTGSGYIPGETVTIKLENGSNSYFLKTVTADSSGGFSTTVQLPTGVSGPSTIVSTGSTSGHSGSAAIVIGGGSGSGSSSKVSDSTPCEGCSVTVAGSGYSAGETVTIRLKGSSGSYFLATVTANSSGNFSTSVKLPSGVTGSYTIVSTGSNSGHVQSSSVTIGGSSSKVSNTSPCEGCSVTVNGSGYSPGETVTIRLVTSSGSYYSLATVTADSSGNFSTSVKLPSGVTGSYTIVSTGAKSGHVQSSSVTIGSSGSGTGSGSGTNGGLPNTGAAVIGIGSIGLLLLMGGGVLLLVGRRRRHLA